MTFKILSLDGGGPWALIQALALGDLFPGASGHEILGHFDLAIANSGGSITLAGLLKNLTPTQICNLFLDAGNRNKIFQRISFFQYLVDKKVGVGPKWSTAGKIAGLTALMDAAPLPSIADVKMSALPDLVRATTGRDLQVIITAFEYDLTREIFFSSDQQSVFSTLGTFEPTLANAVHASSNAPVNYFNAPAIFGSVYDPTDVHRFWDGGVGGFNNPVLNGVAQALSQGCVADDIMAISIGTGTVWRPPGPPDAGESEELFHSIDNSSTIGDIKKLAESILDDPPDAASTNAHFAIGGSIPSRIIRLNPFIAPEYSAGAWILPPGFSKFHDDGDPAAPIGPLVAFTSLRDMPMDATDRNDVELINQLAMLWIGDQIRNQPILHDQITSACLFGYDYYSKGKKAAVALSI
jgi:uncharacterized protein